MDLERCIFAMFLLARMIGRSGSLSGKFRTVYDPNVVSTKVNMSVITARSRIRCAAFCQHVFGCGGYNVMQLNDGSFQCEFKQGRSKIDQLGERSDVTYYELSVQNRSVLSRDCSDLQTLGANVSRVYDINLDPDGKAPDLRSVYCDMDTDGGGWTTLMKREDGSVDFNRNWANYRNGFGNISGEYWLGLETMYRLLTNGRTYKLRVDMTLFTGQRGYTQYDYFVLESEADAYRLHVSGPSGTADDALSAQNGLPFSTIDVDNDQASYCCAYVCSGGFWYKSCAPARLTALYGENLPPLQVGNINFIQGILWIPWLDADTHPRYADMKIRA